MEKDTLNKLVWAFITLILGIALVVQAAASGNTVTQKVTTTETLDVSGARLEGDVINETYTFTPAVVTTALNTWRTDFSDCSSATIIDGTYTNASGSAYTEDTDYVIGTGSITLVNTELVNGSTDAMLASISYCPDEYLTSSWSRNAINYAIGFFALSLLGVSLALFYSLFKEYF